MRKIIFILFIISLPLFGSDKIISVIGYGSVKVDSNRVTIRSGVESSHKDIKKAISQNSQKIDNIFKGLSKIGLGRESVETRDYNVYKYTPYSSVGNGGEEYRVSYSLVITLDDMDMTDRVLAELVNLGANRIEGIDFSMSNPEVYKDELLKDALNDAREKATVLASHEGMKISQVISIKEATDFGGGAPEPRLMASEAKVGPIPVSPGSDYLSTTYYVTYSMVAK